MQLQLRQAQLQVDKGPDAQLQAHLEKARAELQRVRQVTANNKSDMVYHR